MQIYFFGREVSEAKNRIQKKENQTTIFMKKT